MSENKTEIPVFLKDRNTNTKIDMPTTFELAQLAAQIPGMLHSMQILNDGKFGRNPPVTFHDVVEIAMQLWNESAHIRIGTAELEEKIKTLFSPERIFNVPSETYNQLFAEVLTTNSALAMSYITSPTIETELCIKKLLRDKSESLREKRARFISLAPFGVKHEIFFVTGPRLSVDQIKAALSADRMSPLMVRWAMDAHAKRLSINKMRDNVPKHATRKS